MMDADSQTEKSIAVSFSNKFFVLADGLVPGIHKYLAKEVALNWFGKTIKGKRKVAAFLNNSKVSTTHVFTNIIPVDDVKYQVLMCTKSTCGTKIDKNTNVDEMNNQLECKNMPNCECTDSMPEVNKSNQISEEKASKCELNENDLNTLSSLDITQMKYTTNKTKVEEMMSQFNNIKVKCGHRDDPEMLDTKSNPLLKCVEAHGKIVCSEKLHKYGLNPNLHFLSTQHTWTKNCKLTIAYTIGKPENKKVDSRNRRERKSTSYSECQTNKLPTFDQIIAQTNEIIPNTDHFAGYLRDYHFYAERKKFYQEFRSEMSKRSHDSEHDTSDSLDESYPDIKKCRNNDFAFDYSIYYISYENISDEEVD